MKCQNNRYSEWRVIIKFVWWLGRYKPSFLISCRALPYLFVLLLILCYASNPLFISVTDFSDLCGVSICLTTFTEASNLIFVLLLILCYASNPLFISVTDFSDLCGVSICLTTFTEASNLIFVLLLILCCASNPIFVNLFITVTDFSHLSTYICKSWSMLQADL